jgi:iron complex transport system substrate-binding protein
MRKLTAALMTAALALVACGTENGGTDDAKSDSNPARRESGPIHLTDQRGVTVTLDAPAQRVVTIPMPAASLLIALDGGPARLAGVQASSAKAIRDEVLGEFYPDARAISADVASDSFAPNVEAILKLKPDLVVQWGDRGPDLVAPLENAGVKVVGLKYGAQQDLETWMRILGEAIGKPDRAAQLIEWHHSAQDDLKARAAKLPAAKPKILYFNRLKGDLRVAGAGTYNDFYISMVGGQNPAAGLKGLAPVNAEQVAAWDPDIVLVGNFDEARPADVYANPAWRDLSAVRSKRVYQVPLGGYRWDPPNQESPLMWWWLAELAHPQAFDFDLRAETKRRYGFLYGREPTDAQLDKILRTDLNRGATGYDRVIND